MHLTPYYAPADNHAGGGNQAPSFCPNCGHPVSPNDTFCQNCGYNLMAGNQGPAQSATPSRRQQQQQQQPATPQPPRRPRQPWTKKQKLQWGGIGLAVLIVLLLGVWGGHHYSRTATLDRAVKSIKTGKKMTPNFSSRSSALKLTNAKLLPLNHYYRKHSKALSTLKDQLLTRGSSHDGTLTYRQTGRHFLFFPKYQIQVTPIYPRVTTNHANTKISLDHKTVATADSSTFSRQLGPLVPGEYHLESSGKVGKHHLINSSDYHITKSRTYDLGLTTITATVHTVAGSAIYMNGQKLGIADSNGYYELKNQPWSPNMTLYAEYTSNAGTARSASLKVAKGDDGNADLSLDYSNLISEDTADDIISNLFMMVDDMTTGTDPDDEADDDDNAYEDYFDHGSSNTNYQQFVRMAHGYNDDDDIDYTEMADTDIKGIAPGPKGRSLVTYTVKYKFWNTANDDDDEEAHVQVYQYVASLRDTSDDDSTDMNYQITTISGAQKLRDYHSED